MLLFNNLDFSVNDWPCCSVHLPEQGQCCFLLFINYPKETCARQNEYRTHIKASYLCRYGGGTV